MYVICIVMTSQTLIPERMRSNPAVSCFAYEFKLRIRVQFNWSVSKIEVDFFHDVFINF